MRRRLLLFALFILLVSGKIIAQKITGTVVDAQQAPIPGVAVTVKDATIGTTTDLDGKFELNVPNASTQTVVFSFLGYKTQERAIGRNTNFNIVLDEDTKQLEDVVVVGYGVQKKSLLTGAIASVSAKDIANIPNDGRAELALQGRTPGVIVGANSGQPGDNYNVRVRGLTSITQGNDPLWVVDGIVVQTSNLNYLNQADIQSIEVLKDAASAAIYGTRAGNGVILVTTKQGSAEKFTVNYNGFVGTQAPARLAPMANATQYATLMNEAALNDGSSTLPYPNPSSLGAGTNWQKAIFSNNAFRTNHDISLSGGNKNANIYASFGYQNQDGIVLPQVSGFEKYSMRINHNENFGKIFKFGQAIAYTRNQSKALKVNTEINGAVNFALALDPFTPVIANAQQAQANQYNTQNAPYNILAPNGMPYGISALSGWQEIENPVAFGQLQLGNTSYSDNFVGNSYLEINPIKELTIRSQISLNRNYWGGQSFTPLSYLGPTASSNNLVYNHLDRNINEGTEWNWDNTATYAKTIEKNTFSIMGGYSISDDGIGTHTNISVQNVPADNYKDANFNWPTTAAQITAGTGNYIRHTVESFFGRINYDYAQKYLATIIVRHDGSTRFGADNRWGTFPSVSVGWVPSLENFWTDHINADAFDFLKIRAGYGVTGNDNLGDFAYAATIGGGNNYVFGTSGVPVLGNSPMSLANPDLKWEQTAQTNIGLDAHFLRDFNFTFDYFYKKTSGDLMTVSIPLYTGVPYKPWANVGDVTNQGVEFQLTYNKQVNEWRFGAIANFATLKNRVASLGVGTPYMNAGGTYQTMGYVNRDVPGYPLLAFWGYKTNGVFQTQADVQNYKSADGMVIQPNAQPGDFRWTDVDGNGTINSNDMTYLGSPLPTYNYGLTLTAEYGNNISGKFDFMIFFQGQGGNKIFQGYRRLDIAVANFPLDYLNRWTGPGSTNSYPRLTVATDPNGNFTSMSDFYLHDGAYMRIQNAQLGYTLPSKIEKAIKASKIRIYVSAENLATITGYTGYDPAVGSNPGSNGIDKGFYPIARTYMVGLNLQF